MTTGCDAAEDMASFGVGLINPGDLAVFPPGFVLVEKSCNSNAFGMRSPLHLVHRKDRAALELIKNCGFFSGKLVRVSALSVS